MNRRFLLKKLVELWLVDCFCVCKMLFVIIIFMFWYVFKIYISEKELCV